MTGIIRPMPAPKRNMRPRTPGMVVSRVMVESRSIEPSIISEPVAARIL